MTLGPPFGRIAALARVVPILPAPESTPESQADSVLAAAAASSLRTELWIQSDANGGIRVTLGSRLGLPTPSKRSKDRLRAIEGAA